MPSGSRRSESSQSVKPTNPTITELLPFSGTHARRLRHHTIGRRLTHLVQNRHWWAGVLSRATQRWNSTGNLCPAYTYLMATSERQEPRRPDRVKQNLRVTCALSPARANVVTLASRAGDFPSRLAPRMLMNPRTVCFCWPR